MEHTDFDSDKNEEPDINEGFHEIRKFNNADYDDNDLKAGEIKLINDTNENNEIHDSTLDVSDNENPDIIENKDGSIITAHYMHRRKNIGTKEYIYGYSPPQIKKAYSFSKCCTGKGQAIAIVSAFNYPTLKNDLDVFSRQFHLPSPNLEIIYAGGTVPPTDSGWAMETALDVQWAYALAPKAKIFAVLAASNTFVDLFQAVDAATQTGANVVSMSWAGAEFSGESTWDSHFSHPGTIYVAGSGDVGGETVYPSVSQYVLSAGGTRLELDKRGNRLSPESAWINGGGGPSLFIPIPPWQRSFKSTYEKTLEYRGTPDIAFNSDIDTGVAIYDSTPFEGLSGWTVIGGTSAAAPSWAAITAIMGQGRKRFSNLSEFLYCIAGKTDYAKPQRYFNDIFIGSNIIYPATEGWDFCTGLGTPIVHRLCGKAHRFRPIAWLNNLLGKQK